MHHVTWWYLASVLTQIWQHLTQMFANIWPTCLPALDQNGCQHLTQMFVSTWPKWLPALSSSGCQHLVQLVISYWPKGLPAFAQSAQGCQHLNKLRRDTIRTSLGFVPHILIECSLHGSLGEKVMQSILSYNIWEVIVETSRTSDFS